MSVFAVTLGDACHETARSSHLTCCAYRMWAEKGKVLMLLTSFFIILLYMLYAVVSEVLD
jgi:hypothetical protein